MNEIVCLNLLTSEPAGYPDFVFAFHDSVELGPTMLVRIARHTGLQPQDF